MRECEWLLVHACHLLAPALAASRRPGTAWPGACSASTCATLHCRFYGGDGRLLACQVIEVLVLAAWTTVFMGG
jgi:hypothetical protein